MRSTRWSVLGSLLALLVMVGALSPAAALQPATHGIDPANLDPAVDPAEDFYRFVNGGWLDRTEIPGYAGSYGVFTELRDTTRLQLLGLLDDAIATDSLAEGSDPWKAAELFRQGTDLETRNTLGIAPVQPLLDEIAAIEDLAAYHVYLQTAQLSWVSGLFPVEVGPSLDDSTVNTVYLNSAYLGLPNRDYYLDEGPDQDAIRAAYIATSAELLVYAGYDAAAAEQAATAVYDLEATLAAATMTREDQQDFALMNNPRMLVELADLYPMMDWEAYASALGIGGIEQVVVPDVAYMEALGGIVSDSPIEVLRDYSTLELLWSVAPYLDEEIGATAFALEGGVLSGVSEQRPIDERTLDQVTDQLGEPLGQLYVEAYFPPEAKQEITALVDALIVAFGQRLDANPWMSDETRARAHEKLAAITVKVGYPDQWRSFANVENGDSYVASTMNASRAEMQRQLAQAGQPVDRDEWSDPPQTVNAYYNPMGNEIIFPAGILQAPFFDYQADAALNFGGIGYVIGHEITHGFDLTGSQFDADGNLRNWWADEDLARFTELNGRLADQYIAIEVLPGLFINGQLTIGENAADLGGLQIAHDALGIHLAGQDGAGSLATPIASPAATPWASPAATFDVASLTPQQQFFVSAATVWRQKTRDESLATQVRTDPHSPAQVRATMPLRNMDAFHEAFGIEPGDAMYLAPEDRVVIW